MSFKEFGPGAKTGAEGDAMKVGNQSYYPGRESAGYVTGGEPEKTSVEGSTVPSRPNPQSGNLSGVKSDMQEALRVNSEYGGHGVAADGFNPTGSSITDPAGERTSHEDGQYGMREPLKESDAEPVQTTAPKSAGGGTLGYDAKSQPGTNQS